MAEEKVERREFIKLLKDFTNDILITFPELNDNLDSNLSAISKCETEKYDLISESVEKVWVHC